MSFKLKQITLHQAENFFINNQGVMSSIDCERHKVTLEELPSGKVNVFFKNDKGEECMAGVGLANIKAYVYYPKTKEEKKK